MLSWKQNLSTYVVCVCVRRDKASADRENCEEMHYNVLPKMRCRTLYWASHKTELLGVIVTIDFQWQYLKNLISVRYVNCIGRQVTINFKIPASKFQLVVSDSK